MPILSRNETGPAPWAEAPQQRAVLMQVKLLRFLQDATFMPVGGRIAKRADVRIVAATHRDLETMVAEGGFREDVFYRLKGMVLRTPALAERTEDIPLLAGLFLRRAAPASRLAADASAWLAHRDWPGNVRELRAMVEAAAALAAPAADVVDAALLRFVAGEADEAASPAATATGSLAAAIAGLETLMLREALTAAQGNQSEAARLLGIFPCRADQEDGPAGLPAVVIWRLLAAPDAGGGARLTCINASRSQSGQAGCGSDVRSRKD